MTWSETKEKVLVLEVLCGGSPGIKLAHGINTFVVVAVARAIVSVLPARAASAASVHTPVSTLVVAVVVPPAMAVVVVVATASAVAVVVVVVVVVEEVVCSRREM